MATLTLKNVPDELYARLKASAARNRRSLNQEAIRLLEGSAPPEPRTPGDEHALIERIRMNRDLMAPFYLTEDEMHTAIAEGRE